MKPIVSGLLVVLVAVAVVNAQGQPEFEVATVKLSPPAQPGISSSIRLGIPVGLVGLTNATLGESVQFAYGLVSDTLVIGPDWAKSRDVRFDIVARAPRGTPLDILRVMTQNLLADRLKLVVHREKRELPFLALVVAKNGRKLHPAKPDDGSLAQIPGHISHPYMPMDMLATLLSRFERQTVIDVTGLAGAFTVDLKWTPDALRSHAPQDGAAPVVKGNALDVDGPSLPTALEEQLGLRLESRKGPLDVIVVDHAERVPVDN